MTSTAIVVDEVAEVIRKNVCIGLPRAQGIAQELFDLGLLTPHLIQPGWKKHLMTSEEAIPKIDAYARHLEVRGLSKNTIVNYTGSIRSFLDIGQPFTVQGVENAILTWKARGNADATILCRQSALKSFSTWLHHAGYMEVDVLAGMIVKRVRKKRRAAIPTDDVHALLDFLRGKIEAGETGADWWGWETSYAVAVVLMSTGCRASELAGLRQANVDLDGCRMEVFGKGSRWRTIPFDEECRDVLAAQMERVNTLFAQIDMATELVFPAVNGEETGYRQIRHVIHRATKAAGLKASHPHAFRHYYATNLRDKGVPLHVIQKMLGHSSISTTETYLHTSYEEAEDILREVMAA